MGDFEAWRGEVIVAWRATAPSYVAAEMAPLDGHLRELWAAGATVQQLREAFEIAFASRSVTKRRALQYAYGIVRRRLAGGLS